MDFHMLHQIAAHGERLAAFGTTVGFLSCMRSHVLLQVRLGGTRLGAHGANVRLLAGVGLYVTLHVALLSEHLGTHGTGESLLVGLPMQLHFQERGKYLGTVCTFVLGLLIHVDTDMILHLAQRRKCFVTAQTFEDFSC
jgi:hypothetical protein